MSEISNSAAKRRACDECRSRKLACSKEADGCERCIRENIECHYSEQKPMGRPRKRKLNEVAELAVPMYPGSETDIQPIFSDNAEACDDYAAFTEPLLTSVPSALRQEPFLNTNSDEGRAMWTFDMKIPIGPPIQFEQMDFGGNDFDPLDQSPPADSTPQLSANSGTAITGSRNSPSQNAPCSCLASMYLALAALQQLPSDIKTALYTVRSACNTAQKSIWCPQCGSVMLSDRTAPIESFQNTMLLGTVLPVIANGYRKLLEMIDDHTNAAIKAGQTMVFEFQGYGAIIHDVDDSLAGSQAGCLGARCKSGGAQMQPADWRSTVRALLRMDIYGHEQSGFKHKGLKDIVDEMEMRQKTRHLVLDAHAASGTSDWGQPEVFKGGHFGPDPGSPQLCLGEKTATCLEIIKMAKYAIDSLVIA